MAEKSKQQQPRVLRIGIVQGGKVVHERLIKPGQHVTVGDSPKNTFTFPLDTPVKKYTLFVAKGPGKYQLIFSDQMSGKLSYQGGVATLDQLVEKGDVTRKGANFTLPLSSKSRGKIVIGQTVVLFQFVAAPPESARMLNNKDFKPRLADPDDQVFLGFLALWSAIGIVLMIYVVNTPPVVVTIEETQERFVDLVLPPDKPKKEEPPPKPIEQEIDPNAAGPAVDKARDSGPKKAKSDKPKSRGEKVAAAKNRAANRAEVLQKSKLLIGIFGTRGENNSGMTVADVFADSDANAQSLSEALDGVGGVQVAQGGEVSMRGQTDSSGRGDASIGALAQGGGGSSNVKEVKVAAPTANMSTGRFEASSGEGADAIRGVLRAKQGQIKYCYEKQLKANPKLAGRVVAAVYISGGKVNSVEIDENSTGDSELGKCIVGKIRRWRFPPEVSDTIYLPFVFSAN